MLDIEQLTPPVYSKNSRDFQFFSKLLQTAVNSVKYNADNLQNMYDPFKCNDRMLDLLCSIYNYQPKNNPTDQDLRVILTNYTRLMKNKGNRLGIEQAVAMALKLQHINREYSVVIKRMVNSGGADVDTAYNENGQLQYDQNNSFIITIGINNAFEMKYLKEFLDLVKPVGYLYNAKQVEMTSQSSRIGGTFEIVEGTFTNNRETYSMTNEETGAVPAYKDRNNYGQITQLNRQEITREDNE